MNVRRVIRYKCLWRHKINLHDKHTRQTASEFATVWKGEAKTSSWCCEHCDKDEADFSKANGNCCDSYEAFLMMHLSIFKTHSELPEPANFLESAKACFALRNAESNCYHHHHNWKFKQAQAIQNPQSCNIARAQAIMLCWRERISVRKATGFPLFSFFFSGKSHFYK